MATLVKVDKDSLSTVDTYAHLTDYLGLDYLGGGYFIAIGNVTTPVIRWYTIKFRIEAGTQRDVEIIGNSTVGGWSSICADKIKGIDNNHWKYLWRIANPTTIPAQARLDQINTEGGIIKFNKDAGCLDYHGITFDGKDVWVGTRCTNEIQKLDRTLSNNSSFRIVEGFSVPASITDLCFDGLNFWCTFDDGDGTSTLRVYDRVGNRIRNLPVESELGGICTDGNCFYIEII